MSLLIVEPDSFPIAKLLYGTGVREPNFHFASHSDILNERIRATGKILLSGIEALPLSEQDAICHALRTSREVTRICNQPSAVPRRYAHLHALRSAGFNEIRVWFGRDVLEADAFPVALRHVVTGSMLSPIIVSREGLMNACGRLACDLEQVLGVQLCLHQGPDDLYRKYSCFVVGNITIPAHLHLGQHWIVRGRNRVRTSEAKAEEVAYLDADPHREELCQAAALCGVDFARVDYGILGGRVQVFEFNMTPGLGVPAGHAHREEAVRSALRDALLVL